VTDPADRTTRGRQILAGLQTYPLRPGRDLRDYVFYFVPVSDGYGKGARIFFRNFYPRHRSFLVTSLEHLFKVMEQEIVRAGETVRIREIVIVAHSNSWGVNAPLTHRDYLADRRKDPQASYLYAQSIAALQHTILTEHLAFQRSRARVLRHLDDASWVTVRSCNFGFSPEGMFALYTVFGGRANLYAPQAYMTFATIPIDGRHRLATHDAAHEYLRKQGFLNRDPVSAGRRNAAVSLILGRNHRQLPIQFFIPDEHVYDLLEGLIARIATTHPNDGASQPPIPYEELRKELNIGRTDTLRKILAAESDDLVFENRVRLSTLSSQRWELRGRIRGATRTYTIRERTSREGDGSARRELGLFEPLSFDQRLSSEPPWTRYGVPYDLPGTELQSYFDRFSIDDLTCLQDVIRRGYQPRDAVVIEHAQRSIERRRDFLAWFTSTPCFRTIIATNDPLFGPDDQESCYWSPFPPRGLKDAEQSDLGERAHMDHNGYQLWSAVKASLDPEITFREDLFLEYSLPDGSDLPDSPRESDIVTPDDRAPTAAARRHGSRADRAKDEPLGKRAARVPRTEVLRGLSDAELIEALNQILAQRQMSTAVFSQRTQRMIEIADLTIGTLISVIGEVEAWAPSGFIRLLSRSHLFFHGANVFYATIFSPLLGWVFITTDWRRATEAHRAWGMRAALGQAGRALRVLSIKLRNGQDIPNLTIPAVREEGNVERQVELRNYVATARKAMDLENWGFVHEKFLAGYDLVIGEVAKLTNEVVRATDELVRQQFADLGLTNRQVDMVLVSGVIDMKRVYAVAFDGLARLLEQQTDKFIGK
jgi:hypothetical protein